MSYSARREWDASLPHPPEPRWLSGEVGWVRAREKLDYHQSGRKTFRCFLSQDENVTISGNSGERHQEGAQRGEVQDQERFELGRLGSPPCDAGEVFISYKHTKPVCQDN